MRRPIPRPLASPAPPGLLALLLAALPFVACAQHAPPAPVAPADSVRAGVADAALDGREWAEGGARRAAARDSAGGAIETGADGAALSPTRPRTRADSIAWRTTRAAAERDTGYRVVVSLEERRVRVLEGADTLLDAPAGVGSFETLEYAGRSWTFVTPRGRRRVLAKTADPVWVPPDWHYAEVAREHGFRLAWLSGRRPTRLPDGSRLEVRAGRVGVVRPGGTFAALPVDEEIVFDSTLYVPPVGTANRRVVGELGSYRLDLGGGYLLHGTPHTSSIGEAATHGCIRLADADIAWLFAHVPLGTRVYIF